MQKFVLGLRLNFFLSKNEAQLFKILLCATESKLFLKFKKKLDKKTAEQSLCKIFFRF